MNFASFIMNKNWQSVALLILLAVGHSECTLGEKCSSYCYTDSKVIGKDVEICVDGFCECDPDIELRYSSYDMNPNCDGSFYSLKVMFGNCNDTSCSENEECVKRLDTVMTAFSRKDTYNSICRCKEGFIRFNTKCIEFQYQKPLQSCYDRDSNYAFICDLKKHSFCKKRKCICHDSFYPNTTSGECEPMADYVSAYNLTSYKVKPGEYCVQDSHCIVGLTCSDFKCKCPPPCTYNRKEELCDCGEVVETVEAADVVWPAIVGVIGSCLIIYFWCRMCKHTRHKYERKRQRATGDDQEVTTSPESIVLTPQAASSSASQILFRPPENKTPAASPLVPHKEKSSENLPGPVQPPSYGLSPHDENGPPHPSLYGIGQPPTGFGTQPPTGFGTQPPTDFGIPPPYAPPYSDNPPPDAPPPYSLLPPPMSSVTENSPDTSLGASGFSASPNPTMPSAPALPDHGFDASAQNSNQETTASNKM